MGSLVDLFAGCGGMSYGMERAGFDSIYVNELSPDAMSTYLQNQPRGSHALDEHHRSNDIHELTGNVGRLTELATHLRQTAGGDIDFVTGGPPCQGFSRIGHRRTFKLEKEAIPSNHLYKEMAAAIEALQPKTFIFENVQGLVSARWTASGQKGEIWRDVKDTFSAVSAGGAPYVVQPELVHAKQFGVPQNRPRVIIVGVRADVAKASGFDGKWLPENMQAIVPPNPEELLGDLCATEWTPGGATSAYTTDPQNAVQTHLRTRRDGTVMGKGSPLTEHEFSNHSVRVQERFHLIRSNKAIPTEYQTKKFNQRVIPRRWPDGGPTMTVASLPDDFVHYSENRAPTVREWARFQGFPDWYEFSGPRTTGGRRRAGDPSLGVWTRDLPKFTQIGNAVPVHLAEWLGRHLGQTLGL